ncbi:MAG: GatB/YqeY domain-containing protein [Chloroflexi bacterium]|nr:GatB/YqeY domain-containing protein [Chloroflexota bacterium]
MDTKARLEQALKDALRAKDTLRKETLRTALAEIKMAEVEKQRPLSEAEVLTVLQKQVKMRRETLEAAQQAGRDDLIARTQEVIRVLEAFLPQPLSEAELEALAREVIAEVGAQSPRDMGKVMKALMPRLQGRATGQQASQVVRRLLAGGGAAA